MRFFLAWQSERPGQSTELDDAAQEQQCQVVRRERGGVAGSISTSHSRRSGTRRLARRRVSS